MITINLKNRCSSKKSLALFMQTNITHLKELEQTKVCRNARCTFFLVYHRYKSVYFLQAAIIRRFL